MKNFIKIFLIIFSFSFLMVSCDTDMIENTQETDDISYEDEKVNYEELSEEDKKELEELDMILSDVLEEEGGMDT